MSDATILGWPRATFSADEICLNCEHCAGPIVHICTNPESEFAGPVHPLGWCLLFKAKEGEARDAD